MRIPSIFHSSTAESPAVIAKSAAKRGFETSHVKVAQTPEELNRIFRLRYDVYIKEMGEPLKADHAHQILRDDLDEGAVHFYAEKDGEIAGVARLHVGSVPESLAGPLQLSSFSERHPESLAYVSRLIVAPSARKSVTTASLMIALYNYARSHGVEFTFLHCYPRLVALYMKLGFVQYCDSFEAPQGTQMPLLITMTDVEHFRRIGSIYANPADEFPRDPEPAAWLRRKALQGYFPFLADVQAPTRMAPVFQAVAAVA